MVSIKRYVTILEIQDILVGYGGFRRFWGDLEILGRSRDSGGIIFKINYKY